MTAVLAAKLIAATAIALAIGELLFVLAWRFGPLHAPRFLDRLMARRSRLRTRRHVVGRFIGAWLSLAPRRNIRMRVQQLFTPSLLTDRRSAAQWQVWYNAHIPAFIVAGSPGFRMTSVTCSIMDGLTDAARLLVAEHERTGDGPIAFDSFWPILESLEELAAHLPISAHDRFAEKLLELCSSTRDATVQSATAWIVNELVGRTAAEKMLARTIIRLLYPAAPHASRVTLQIMAESKDDVRNELAAIEKSSRRVIPTDDVILESYRRACTIGSELAEKFEGTSPQAARDFVQELCTIQTFDSVRRLGVEGLAWMSYRRKALYTLCWNQRANADTILNVCVAAMACAEEQRTCAFLTIEALEAVRDNWTAECIEAMSSFLGASGGLFDQGIAVCIAEGFEEQESRNICFERTAAKWTGQKSSSLATATERLLKTTRAVARTAPMTRWINLRLDLREEAVRARKSSWGVAS